MSKNWGASSHTSAFLGADLQLVSLHLTASAAVSQLPGIHMQVTAAILSGSSRTHRVRLETARCGRENRKYKSRNIFISQCKVGPKLILKDFLFLEILILCEKSFEIFLARKGNKTESQFFFICNKGYYFTVFLDTTSVWKCQASGS